MDEKEYLTESPLGEIETEKVEDEKDSDEEKEPDNN